LKTNYGYWQHIYGRKLYDIEQDQVSDQVIDLLERFYPGLRQDIEVVDVATPLSYERYTGNWLGSTCGWLPGKPPRVFELNKEPYRRFACKLCLPVIGRSRLVSL
jgi:phytoene dehydrogenase-like protein